LANKKTPYPYNELNQGDGRSIIQGSNCHQSICSRLLYMSMIKPNIKLSTPKSIEEKYSGTPCY